MRHANRTLLVQPENSKAYGGRRVIDWAVDVVEELARRAGMLVDPIELDDEG